MHRDSLVDFLLGALYAGALLLVAVAISIGMSGCATSGLYQMSDEWCAKNPEAAPERCSRNPLKQYDLQGHQLAGQHPVAGACPGRYTYGAYGVTITCWGQQ